MNGWRRGAALAATAVVALTTVVLAGARPAGANATEIDPTFAGGGLTGGPPGDDGGPKPVVVQPDGKVVMVSDARHETATTIQEYVVVARFDSSGSPDSSFGANGLSIIELGSGVSVFATALQPDGKILVSGDVDGDPFLMRFGTTGTPDAAFGVNGVARFDLNDVSSGALSIAVLADGEVITGYPRAYHTPVLTAVTSAGVPVATFGSGGVLDIGPNGEVGGVAAQGSSVLVGIAGYDGKSYVQRVSGPGVVDATFAGGGVYVLSSSRLIGLVVEPAGSYLVAWNDTISWQTTAVGRFTADGMATGPLVSAGPAFQVVRGPVGQLALVGSHDITEIRSSLTVDEGFGVGGTLHFDLSPGNAIGGAAFQSDSRLMVSGQYFDPLSRETGTESFLFRLITAPAGADDDPIGYYESIAASVSGAHISGWALDPDTPASVEIDVYVDGAFAAYGQADGNRSDIGAAFPQFGPNHGFEIDVPVGDGTHSVCAYAINIAYGVNASLGCRSITVNANPFGQVDAMVLRPGGLSVQGWVIDPQTAGEVEVDILVDGQLAGYQQAQYPRPDVGQVFPAYGPNHGFEAAAAVPGGTHTVCVYGINVGVGSNQLLRCQVVDVPATPFGQLEVNRRLSAGVGYLEGWAIDAQTKAGIEVDILVDGVLAGYGPADRTRPDVAGVFPLFGERHGFVLTYALPAGPHTVCPYAINVGEGTNTSFGCTTVNG